MAISLTKTLRGTTYTLRITTEIVLTQEGQCVTRELAYQSVEHMDDGFFPMIQKMEIITDAVVTATVFQNYYTNYSIAQAAIENYLITNSSWYSGGTIA